MYTVFNSTRSSANSAVKGYNSRRRPSCDYTQGRIMAPSGPKAWKRLRMRVRAPRCTVLPWHGSASQTFLERIVIGTVRCLAKFLENPQFFLCINFRGIQKWWTIFVVDPDGPEALVSQTSWMISPWLHPRKCIWQTVGSTLSTI